MHGPGSGRLLVNGNGNEFRLTTFKGVAEQGSRTKSWWGGVRLKAKKIIVTAPVLMVEVVVDVLKGALDGSPGVQDVFESL